MKDNEILVPFDRLVTAYKWYAKLFRMNTKESLSKALECYSIALDGLEQYLDRVANSDLEVSGKIPIHKDKQFQVRPDQLLLEFWYDWIFHERGMAPFKKKYHDNRRVSELDARSKTLWIRYLSLCKSYKLKINDDGRIIL